MVLKRRNGVGIEERDGKKQREGQENGLKRRNGIGIEERDGKKAKRRTLKG